MNFPILKRKGRRKAGEAHLKKTGSLLATHGIQRRRDQALQVLQCWGQRENHH